MDNEVTDEESVDKSLIQSGSGLKSNFKKRKISDDDDDEFISKVARAAATIVTENLQNPLKNARPVNTTWTNFNLSAPSTSIINSPNSTPPLHYGIKKIENDDNDTFDQKRLLKTVPARYKGHAAALLKQFSERGTELNWNSDGVIFVDQTSIPQSDIFILFPYLFKHKHPKNLTGLSDFIDKIDEMGLSHLIVKQTKANRSQPKLESSSSSPNWWFLD